MTVVLSMNRFCNPVASEGTPEIPDYRSVWESEHQGRTRSLPSHIHAQHQEHGLCDSPAETHYRGKSNPITTPKITYFKRKYVEEEDYHPPLGSCSPKNISIFEERAHVLYMSLEKLKFIDDPEVFLRRSVLINNLMKRIHGEILLQNNWCFSACSLGGPSAHEWFVPQDCPYRKRLRVAKEETHSLQTCCFYQDCGSHYLNMPFSVTPNGGNAAASTSSGSLTSLPGCSQSVDYSMGDVTFYRNGVQMPSCVGTAAHSRPQGLQQKANGDDGNPADEKRGGLSFGCDVANGGSAPEHRGRFYDFLATGCNDKSSVSDPWKKSIRKKELPALCCSKGSKA
ncbi:SERTA domain-containing protein 4 [Spea bombifrons]|uniref:SERTA domain-containing protein 4 n=1 Tax=Spea bombifrons TaxID=233779 RepID=UPI00234A75F3|nr:SERTA domain-containing protein 4 [Spea bombifrons]XP_053316945.1 SERTA domain-containing protein 4 [Spea bombifrons]